MGKKHASQYANFGSLQLTTVQFLFSILPCPAFFRHMPDDSIDYFISILIIINDLFSRLIIFFLFSFIAII